MIYLLHSVIIVLLLFFIIYDCVLFTNSVENLGKEYKLSDGVVGGILAAIGTALPETVVPLVAVIGAFFTGESVSIGEEVALGAVLGSPFLLSTVAFFVTGISVLICSKLKKRDCKMCENPLILLRDLKFFVISYTVAISCAFIPHKFIKCVIAILLIVFYLIYVHRTLKKDFGCCCVEEPEELILLKLFGGKERFKKFLIILQIIASLILLIVLAHFFVKQILFVASALNIPPVVMSLLLAPIATELPECFNSAIWIGQSKDSLSISNITGALVFQSCIPAAIGIMLTPWVFNQATAMSVVLVYISLICVYLNVIKNKGMLNHRILITCVVFYLIYLFYVLKILI